MRPFRFQSAISSCRVGHLLPGGSEIDATVGMLHSLPLNEHLRHQALTTNLGTLLRAHQALKSARRPLVLAAVVETLGSTYRKAGARMLITEDGQFHGIIGGGCFEGDLLERARRVFADGKPNLFFYDMRAQEDELWGLGLVCNGAVRLLLERLDATQGFDPLATMESCLI